jgi:hypothetical protein
LLPVNGQSEKKASGRQKSEHHLAIAERPPGQAHAASKNEGAADERNLPTVSPEQSGR